MTFSVRKALFLCIISVCLLPIASLAEFTVASEDLFFFDDAVFVGDSVLAQLNRYLIAEREKGHFPLGQARFLVATGYTLYRGSRKFALQNLNLVYKGTPYPLHQALSKMEAGKAFVMLGLNDEPGRYVNRDMEHYKRLMELVRESNPNLTLFALAVTPVEEKGQTKSVRQDYIDLFNHSLKELCAEMDVYFIDTATPLKNQKGFLDTELSNDGYVHLNLKGQTILLDTIIQSAHQLTQEGEQP